MQAKGTPLLLLLLCALRGPAAGAPAAPAPAPAAPAVIPAAQAAAAADLARRCDEGTAAACHELGRSYARGRGLPRDEARALALGERACAAGQLPACEAVGEAREQGTGTTVEEGDMKEAHRLLRGACLKQSDQQQSACFNLHQLYTLTVEDGAVPFDATDREIMGAMCQQGSEALCAYLDKQRAAAKKPTGAAPGPRPARAGDALPSPKTPK
jgi:TPR repeat protein